MRALTKLPLLACMSLAACMSPEEEKVCQQGYQASLTRMHQDMNRGIGAALPDYQQVSVMDPGNTPARDSELCAVYKPDLFKHQERRLVRKEGRDYILDVVYKGRNSVAVLNLNPVLPLSDEELRNGRSERSPSRG
jgi:hypothetical protein